MIEEEKRLIYWTIGDIADKLHSLEQQLFYQVEVKMCQGGKVKPEFNVSTISSICEAKKYITNAEELLTRLTTKPL